MVDVAEYIKRAAQRSGYKRETYIERNVPTQPSNVLAIPFYGDLRSVFLLSSFILKQYKEIHKDKYIILCSWPGMSSLFPYVDEYWSIEDPSAITTLAAGANNFYNETDLSIELTRNLIEVLNVVTSTDLKSYYDCGFTKKYLTEFGGIKRFAPEISSSNKVSSDFKKQMESKTNRKIVVYPATKMKSKQQGKTVSLTVPKDFWVALIQRLLQDGYVPVVYQNSFTYNMSTEFVDKCIYLVSRDVGDVLAAFRHVGCVLDVHTGLSRLAVAARCPYLSVIERQIFVEDKEFEIDDLCCDGLPRQYIFSPSTITMTCGPEEWKVSILDHISARLKEFLPTLSGVNLPSTNELYESVSYEKIRDRKSKRMGVHFINTSKNK